MHEPLCLRASSPQHSTDPPVASAPCLLQAGRGGCAHSGKHGVGCSSPPSLRPPTRKARQKKPGEPVLVVEDPGRVFQSLTLENIRGSVMETPRAGCQSGPESLEGGAPAESSFWESGDYRSPGCVGGLRAARMTPQGLRPRPGTARMWVRGLALHRRAL